MNPIEEIERTLNKSHPDLRTMITYPKHVDGWWWLDVTQGGKMVVLQWKRSIDPQAQPTDIGVSPITDATAYGDTHPDETFATQELAIQRTLALLEVK